MKYRFVKILVVLALSLPSGGVFAQSPKNEVQQEVKAIETTEIKGKDGVIVIYSPKKVQVRVFTILGQLVTQVNAVAGVTEIPIGSRGIYIVKIENRTQKVVL